MSGADDLREALAHRLGVNVLPEFVIDPASIKPIIDIFLEVLAVAEHRIDLLDAMGLAVREGWLNAPHAGVYSVACGTEPMLDVKYLVVRPRGEATGFDETWREAGFGEPPPTASDPFLGDPDAMFEGPV